MTAPSRARRSDTTREAILRAARERFAADGYDRATIRAIAADAGIDPAMVMRYYGNKEKLFAAAAEFDLHLPDARQLPRENLGEALVRHFLHRWEVDDSLAALLRAAVTNNAAAERMRQIFATQVTPAVAAGCPDPAQAGRRAGLIATQILGLALCRYVVQLPPVVAMTPDELAAQVGPTLDRYLTGAD
ncbi:TetR family transcriptional regulator [Micromonospora sp. NPDC007230]|uniref:TetR/AcrR family transcriptional regulator n=1 Tax=Micromonospora sp. NPDC007230 TaxID=3364237 RepID=UPI00367D30FA